MNPPSLEPIVLAPKTAPTAGQDHDKESKIETACAGVLELCAKYARTMLRVPLWALRDELDLTQETHDRRLLGPLTFLAISYIILAITTNVEIHPDESFADYLSALADKIVAAEGLASVIQIIAIYGLLMAANAFLTWSFRKHPKFIALPLQRLTTYTSAWSFSAFSIVLILAQLLSRLPKSTNANLIGAAETLLLLVTWGVLCLPVAVFYSILKRLNVNTSLRKRIGSFARIFVFQYAVIAIAMAPAIVLMLKGEGPLGKSGDWPLESRLQSVSYVAASQALEVSMIIENRKNEPIVVDLRNAYGDVSKVNKTSGQRDEALMLQLGAIRVAGNATQAGVFKPHEPVTLSFQIAPIDSWLQTPVQEIKDFRLTVTLPKIPLERHRDEKSGRESCELHFYREKLHVQ